MFGLHNYEALPVIAELSLILIFTGAIGHFITIVWGTYCDQTLSHHTFIISCCGNYGYSYYQSYSSNPWAREGQVSAYIVSITHRVTGQVIDVHVEDNSKVKKGDLLFEIDPSIYKATYRKALATQKQAFALLAKAKNEEQRALNLEKRTPGAVPVLTLNNLNNAVETSTTNVELAKANVEEAHLNLEYTKVYAPTNTTSRTWTYV